MSALEIFPSRPLLVLMVAACLLGASWEGVLGQPSVAVSWSETEFPGTSPAIVPGVPFTVYVLGLDLPALSGFELSLFLPDCFTVVASTLSTPGTDFGDDALIGGRPNFRVGTGGVLIQGALVKLAEVILVTDDPGCFGPLSVAPSVPSSFSPPSPGYLQFNCAGCLFTLESAEPIFAGTDDGSPWILWFDAGPNPFPLGDPVELGWGLYGDIDSAALDNGIGPVPPFSGSVAISPGGTTVYTLSVENAAGSLALERVVQLQPVVINRFTASPIRVFPEENTTLTWDVSSADQMRIDPGVGPLPSAAGSVVVSSTDTTTTYVLSASNPESSTTAEVTVGPPLPMAFLTVSNPVPFAVDPVLLIASAQNAENLTLEPGFGSIDPSGGNFALVVEEPTTFVLSASSPFGSSTAEVNVTPQVPLVIFNASETNPLATESITLVAAVQGSASTTLEPGFGTINPQGGVFDLVVEQPTTFVLTATNPAGTTTSQLQVVPRPPVVSLTTSNENPIENALFDLTVTIEGGASATLTPGFGAIDPSGGVFTTSVDVPTTFTVTALNAAGSSQASTVVTPRSVVVAPSWSSTEYRTMPPPILAGMPFDLYVVALDLPEAISRYEFRVDLPPCATVVSTEVFGVDTAPGQLDFIVEPANAGLEGDVVPLARLVLEVSALPCNGSILVGPSQPSRVNPPAPAYALASSPLVDRRFRSGQALFFNVSDGIPDPGDLGFFFDPMGTATSDTVTPFVPFELHALTFQIPGGQEGYEFSIDVDDRILVIGETLRPVGAVDFGEDPPPPENDRNYLVGTGGVCFEGPITNLVTWEMLAVAPGSDFAFCAGAASPSSFQPAVPGYLQCNPAGQLRTYKPAYIGCAVANPDSLRIPVGLVECLPPRLVLGALETLDWVEETGRWTVRVSLRNDGTGPARGVAAQLFETATTTTADPNSFFGDIPPGTQRFGDPFVLNLTGGDDPGSLQGHLRVQFQDECGKAGELMLAANRFDSPTSERSRLLQNHPNPFNPRTTIPFVLDRDGHARLELFDARGRLIRVLVDGFRGAGLHTVVWDGTDDSGRQVTAGVYWVRLRHGTTATTRRLALVR